jgi:hypothetical protein
VQRSSNLDLATSQASTNVTLWVDDRALFNSVEHVVQVVARSSKAEAVPNPCYSSEKTAKTGSAATATFAVGHRDLWCLLRSGASHLT